MRGIEIKSLKIIGEDGSCIKAYQDNMGEPYRSGVSIWISRDINNESGSGVFLQDRDLDDLIAGLQAIRNKKR